MKHFVYIIVGFAPNFSINIPFVPNFSINVPFVQNSDVFSRNPWFQTLLFQTTTLLILISKPQPYCFFVLNFDHTVLFVPNYYLIIPSVPHTTLLILSSELHHHCAICSNLQPYCFFVLKFNTSLSF